MASAKPGRYEEVSLEIREFMSSSRVYIFRNNLDILGKFSCTEC